MARGTGRRWWEGAVLYHAYVRSFADSDGDGYGDLRGLTARLDHLAWLGVDGVWLSPTMPSPDDDWGYDVSDYLGVHPELGTTDDLGALVEAAGARGLRVLLDLVPNHTSTAHPWFVDARRGRDAEHRSYYVWADPIPDGGPPTNWVDATGESAWTYDPASGQYYLHNYLETQADLNWWEPRVHEEFRSILRHWFDRGIAGVRIDVAHGLYKDAALRDNPPLRAPDPAGRGGLESRYSSHRPETHGVYRDWRAIAEGYDPERLLLGETWVFDPGRLASYYGDDDELQLAFNFAFALAPFEPEVLASVVGDSVRRLGSGCPVWTASNHDIGRFPTRWACGDPRRVRLALVVLAMLPGALVLYYGDEVGMGDVAVPEERQRDPMTKANRGGKATRDRGRTPLCWSDEPGGGFSEAEPWLPLEAPPGGSVERQRDAPSSVLQLTRSLLALRRRHLGGHVAAYEELAVGPDRWCFRSGHLAIGCNFSRDELAVSLPEGRMLCSSRPERELGSWEAPVRLAPYEAVVVGP